MRSGDGITQPSTTFLANFIDTIPSISPLALRRRTRSAIMNGGAADKPLYFVIALYLSLRESECIGGAVGRGRCL